jgi:hypothetical protein
MEILVQSFHLIKPL